MNRADTFLRVFEALGSRIPGDAKILDFGCGNGDLVHEFCGLGRDAFGCDLVFGDGHRVDELGGLGRMRLIEQDPYLLPFADRTFDVVLSDQVFEHVRDYGSAAREIARVLRTDGATLHLFCPRYSPIEPHVLVPGATVYRAKWWLRLWARLGIRNAYQKGDPPELVVAKNHDYLREYTNYLPRREVRKAFRQHFDVVRFAEREFLRRDEPGHHLRRDLGRIPLFPLAYGAFRNRVLFAARPVPHPSSSAAS